MSESTEFAIPHDLARQPGAFLARSRPVEVNVTFAAGAGVLHTLEGLVAYEQGDALLTGTTGERWPVPRQRFLASYLPAPGTTSGQDGRYVKRPREVWAWRTERPLDVSLPQGTGTLHANAGDVIVQYAPGDSAVVQPEIFFTIYDLLP